MPKSSAATAVLEYWYAALRSQAGVCVFTSKPDLLIQHLYAARREAMDPQLATLSVKRSPTDANEVWIIHREAPDGTQENPSRPEEGDDELPQIELFPDG